MGKLMTAMSQNRQVRIYVADSTDIVEEARKIHDLSPMSTAALGRTLTGAVIMGMMSKIEKETVTFQIKGSNQIKLIVAVSDTKGHVKGYISNPLAGTIINEKGKLAVGESIGQEGELVVVRDVGMKEPFIGRSALVSGEIAEDLTAYFAQSEQIPSAVGLGVLASPAGYVKVAGGFIVQLLPEADEETIEILERNLAGIQSVTHLLESGLSIKQIANQIFVGLGLEELEEYPIAYECDCSKSKMENALISLGKAEIQSIIEEQGQAELVCHFCGEKHLFLRDDLESLLANLSD